jgi:hypothetical protein
MMTTAVPDPPSQAGPVLDVGERSLTVPVDSELRKGGKEEQIYSV